MCTPSTCVCVCNRLSDRVDVRPRPCVSEGPCAFERLHVLHVHVSVSVVYVCVHGRVTVVCGQAVFAPSPAPRFRGAAGCRAPVNRGGGPSRVPGFKDARTRRGPEAALGSRGRRQRVRVQKGAQAGGGVPCPSGGSGWGCRARAPVPVSSPSPGRQDGRVHEGPVHGQGGCCGCR